MRSAGWADAVALKDRLDARRQLQGSDGPMTEATLAVIDGGRPVVAGPPSATGAGQDQGQGSNRLNETVASAIASGSRC